MVSKITTALISLILSWGILYLLPTHYQARQSYELKYSQDVNESFYEEAEKNLKMLLGTNIQCQHSVSQKMVSCSLESPSWTLQQKNLQILNQNVSPPIGYFSREDFVQWIEDKEDEKFIVGQRLFIFEEERKKSEVELEKIQTELSVAREAVTSLEKKNSK